MSCRGNSSFEPSLQLIPGFQQNLCTSSTAGYLILSLQGTCASWSDLLLRRAVLLLVACRHGALQTSDMVEEIYGMSPAEVVERARACGTTGQRERSSGGALPNMPMALSRVFG